MGCGLSLCRKGRKENKPASAPLPAPSSPKLRSAAPNEDAQPLLPTEETPTSPETELALPLATTLNEEFDLGEEDIAGSPPQSPKTPDDVTEKTASPLPTIAKLKTLESPRSVVLVSRPASAASVGSQLRQIVASRPASVESKTLRSSSRPVSAEAGRTSSGGIRSLAASPTSPVPEDALASSPTSDKPKLLDDGDAAVLIQAAYRGYRTRRSLAVKPEPLEANDAEAAEEQDNENVEDVVLTNPENEAAEITQKEVLAETLESPRGHADEEGAETLEGTTNNMHEEAVNEDVEEYVELHVQDGNTADLAVEEELTDAVGSPREQVDAEDSTANDVSEPGLERMPTTDEEEEIWRKIQRDISLEDETQARAATKIQASFRGYRVRRELNAKTQTEGNSENQADVAAAELDDGESVAAVEESDSINLESTNDAMLARQNEPAEVTQERPETEIDENADEAVQENDAVGADATEEVVLAEDDAEILEILQVGDKFAIETEIAETERLVLQTEDGVTDDAAGTENDGAIEDSLTGQAVDTEPSAEEINQDEELSDNTESKEKVLPESPEEVNDTTVEDHQIELPTAESDMPVELINEDNGTKVQDEIQIEEIEVVNDASDLGNEPESLILEDNAEILTADEPHETEAKTEEIKQSSEEEQYQVGDISEICQPLAEPEEAVEESVSLVDTDPVVEESQVNDAEEHEAEIMSTEAENQQINAELLEEASTVSQDVVEAPVQVLAIEKLVTEEGLSDEHISKAADDADQDAEAVITDQNDADEHAESQSGEVAKDQEVAESTPISQESPEVEETVTENEPESVEIPASSPTDILVSEDSHITEQQTTGDEVNPQEEQDFEVVKKEVDVVESGEEVSVEVVTDAEPEVQTVDIEDGTVGAEIQQADDQPTEEGSEPTEEVIHSVVVEAAEQDVAPEDTVCVSPTAPEESANLDINSKPQSSLSEDAPDSTVKEDEVALEGADVDASSVVQSPRETEVPEAVAETTNEEIIVVEFDATESEESPDQTESVEESQAIPTEYVLDSVVVEAAEQGQDAAVEAQCLIEEVSPPETNDDQPSSLVEGAPASVAEEDLDAAKDEPVEGEALVSAMEDPEDSVAVAENPTEADVEQAIEHSQEIENEEPPPEYCQETMAPAAADADNSPEDAEQEQPAEDVTAAEVCEAKPEYEAVLEAEVQATETAEAAEKCENVDDLAEAAVVKLETPNVEDNSEEEKVEDTTPVEAVEENGNTDDATEAPVVEFETPKVEDSEQEKVPVEENKDEYVSVEAISPENVAGTPVEVNPKEDEAVVVELQSTNQTEELTAPANVEPTESFNTDDVQEESLITTSEAENLVEINEELMLIEDSSLITVQDIIAEGNAEQESEPTTAEALNTVDELSELEKTPESPQAIPEPVASPIILPTDQDAVAENEMDDSQDFLHRIVKLENGAEVLVIHHDERSATDMDNDTQPTANNEDDNAGEEGPIVDEALASLTETIAKVAMFLTSPVPAFPASDETPTSLAEDNDDKNETSPEIEEKIVAETLECVPPEAVVCLPSTSLIEDERSMELVIESTEADNNAGIVEATWSPRPSPTEEIVVLENQHKILDKIEEVQHVLGAFTCVIEDLSDTQPPSAPNQLVTDLDDPEWSDCSEAHSSQHSRSSSPYNMQYLDPYYDGAATKIQANYRGYRTRQYLKRRKGMKPPQINDTPMTEAESHDASGVRFEEMPIDGVLVDNELSSQASEEEGMLNSAATKIQARYRGYRTRRQLSKTKQEGATWTELQSIARGKTEAGWDPDKAATKIQAGVRGFLVRRRQGKAKVLSLEESDTVKNNVNVSAPPKCVSLPRGFEYRRGSLPEFQRKHGHKLTSDDRRGSAPYLRLLTRTDSSDGRRQAAAALKIQSAFRGYRVRKHRPLKGAPSAEVEVLDGDSTEDKAATKIQARYRGYRTRSGLKQVKASSADQCDDQVVKAVQTIQAGFRGYKVRKDMGLIKHRSQKE